jgi:hypothetical protein
VSCFFLPCSPCPCFSCLVLRTLSCSPWQSDCRGAHPRWLHVGCSCLLSDLIVRKASLAELNTKHSLPCSYYLSLLSLLLLPVSFSFCITPLALSCSPCHSLLALLPLSCSYCFAASPLLIVLLLLRVTRTALLFILCSICPAISEMHALPFFSLLCSLRFP